MLFRYVTRILHVAIGGRTLAHWQDPLQKVFSPSVDAFRGPENETKYSNFALELFRHVDMPMLHAVDGLVQFRNTMIASLLMHLEDFSKKRATAIWWLERSSRVPMSLA